MKSIIVNHLVLVYLIIAVFVTSCGFQLNRNRAELRNGATSVHIKTITNQSYSPGLDIKLKNNLETKLRNKKIPLQSASNADLILVIKISSLNITKSKFAIDPNDNSQSYRFQFQIKGQLQQIDNQTSSQSARSNSILTSNLTANSSITTQNLDLTENDTQTGKDDAISEFSKTIITQLTTNF